MSGTNDKFFRVWWRLPGVDRHRPTGPWWHRDLHDSNVLRQFVRDHVAVAEDVRFWVLDERPTTGSPLNKRPPDGATSCMFWTLLPEDGRTGTKAGE